MLNQSSLEEMTARIDKLPFPVHEGTIKYLREKGIWTEQHDKWNDEALELSQKYRSTWDEAIKDAKEKGVKVRYDDDEWVELWEGYQDQLPNFKVRS